MSEAAFTENPFYILAIPVTASRVEVERAGQKLLAMLELGLAASTRYETPLGPRERTADRVRQAMADLRDPERRVVAELFAALPTAAAPTPAVTLPPWQGARAAFGWRGPSSR